MTLIKTNGVRVIGRQTQRYDGLCVTERRGTKQELAAARAGRSVKTARKYERAGRLASQLKQPRMWRTRPLPFEEDWPWVVEQ